MADTPVVPYRRMPAGYLAIWLVLMILLIGYNDINRYGWPLPSSGYFLFQTFVSVAFGTYFWGWIFWRWWLYKKFPPK